MNMIKIPKIENVRMLDRFDENKHLIGSLFLTTTHLIFSENKKQIWMLHMHILSVEKQALTTNGCPLLVKCKNFFSATFLVPIERQCHEIFVSLQQLSQPVNVCDLYCFHYTAVGDEKKDMGWNSFTFETEFRRQGVPKNLWTCSKLNSSYEICDTYSSELFVPTLATDHQIRECARFRSKGRLPVLTYYHKSTEASITRCSQPLSGLAGKRSPEDEQMLDCILKSNPKSQFIYIVDTRPRVNAFAQRMAGKGFESELFYENVKFQFYGIENIHVMRTSLGKLLDAAEMKTTSFGAFHAALESSGWLKHIRSVLETATFVARQVQYGISVLVHCSDGWDRTAQTCALASLLLDPYYRTIKGFQALIEKDWLSFGHKFMDRCGIISGDPKEIAPIFTQFIEGVWQLLRQYPTEFEFNERFLITIHDHVYSAQYGTFVGNCEKERRLLELESKSYSLWGHLATYEDAYLNPLRKLEKPAQFLEPSLNPQGLRYWRGMYNRFETGVHPREPTLDRLASLQSHCFSMQQHADSLEQKLVVLRREIENSPPGFQEVIFRDPGKERDDHPLRCSIQFDDMKVESDSKLTSEMTTGAPNDILEWSSLRSGFECPCALPIDCIFRKFHCFSCGKLMCARCVGGRAILVCHPGRRKINRCRSCSGQMDVNGSAPN